MPGVGAPQQEKSLASFGATLGRTTRRYAYHHSRRHSTMNGAVHAPDPWSAAAPISADAER